MTVSNKVSLFFFGVVLLNIAIGVVFFFGKQTPPLDLSSPGLAIDHLTAKSLYFTPSARSYLLAHRPDLVLAEAKKDDSEQTRLFTQATQDPVVWRKLDRELQFDTLLLTGEPGEYRPLLRHLLASKEWVLSYLDQTSLVFKKSGERTWLPEDLKSIRDKFANISAPQRALVLAQLSSKLLAVTQYAESKHCLDQAIELGGKLPDVWTAKALYELHFGQWPQALESANKALECDPNYLAALSAKAHLLFTLHKYPEALAVSKRLVEASPKNPQVLLLHAKIAHEAEDYATETDTLLTIIELGEKEGISTTGYQLFLAQAYAHNGQAVKALEAFDKVLHAPDLTEEQQKSVQECIASVQKNMETPGSATPQ